MLLLALIDRYGLSSADLRLNDKQGFLSQLIEGGWQARAVKDLTSDQEKHLAGWARALFETEGISDDLMSSCTPQDFYLMIATIISQSIIACRKDILSLETLKNGLECRFGTF